MNADTKIVKIKKGSTFGATLTVPTKYMENLNGVTISSAVMTSDMKTYQCEVTVPDPLGHSFDVTISNTITSKWSVGIASWDVKFSRSGVVFYTDTVELHILKNIT